MTPDALPDVLPDVPEMTDDVIDECLTPLVMELVQGLISSGRQPDQAIEDVRRACDHMQAELQRERMATLAAGGDLPD
jgi:hypothetical protein